MGSQHLRRLLDSKPMRKVLFSRLASKNIYPYLFFYSNYKLLILLTTATRIFFYDEIIRYKQALMPIIVATNN